MEKEFSSFRKATFGGFNRKDVISYIEKMRNESFEYKKQVESTVRSLNEKIRELESAARLMENSVRPETVAEADEENAKEYLGDIGQATEHLKTVADELCRSLGDFMDKLSKKGLFEKADESEEVTAVEPEVEQQEVKSLVESILDSISYLGVSVKNTEIKNEEVDSKKEEAVTQMLSGFSFLD